MCGDKPYSPYAFRCRSAEPLAQTARESPAMFPTTSGSSVSTFATPRVHLGFATPCAPSADGDTRYARSQASHPQPTAWQCSLWPSPRQQPVQSLPATKQPRPPSARCSFSRCGLPHPYVPYSSLFIEFSAKIKQKIQTAKSSLLISGAFFGFLADSPYLRSRKPLPNETDPTSIILRPAAIHSPFR